MLLGGYFAFVLPILEIVLRCHLQLLERQVYSVSMLCPDQSFLSLYHRRRVSGLRMLYKVNTNSNHCLFSELTSESFYYRARHTEAATASHALELELLPYSTVTVE